MKQYLVFFLVPLLVFALFVGCGTTAPDETTAATTEAPEAFVTSTIIQAGASEYAIVHDGTAEARSLANLLRSTFKKNFGVTLSVADKTTTESKCEIVIGAARPIAEKTIQKLAGEYDFAMKVEENRLVLYAKNELSYQYMSEHLTRNVFAKTEDGSLVLDSDDNFIYSKSELVQKNYVEYCQEIGKRFTLEQLFAFATYKNADTTLPYRIYVPFNYSPDKHYPLLVALHGAGHRGSDNISHLRFIDATLNMPELSVDEAIIIFPQCPEEQKWVDTVWGQGSYNLANTPESNELKAVVELVGQLQQTYNVDAKRIYACGFSMGGYGTWNLLMNHKDLFCAGVAMCGAADPGQAATLVNTPIWAIHGAKDPTVPVAGSQQMVQAIKDAGGQKIHYTELPDHEHDVWTYTYGNQEIWQWLFAQTKD